MKALSYARRLAAIGLIALLATAQRSTAQVLYGSIVGNVTDASTASVPGAQVIVTETGTGFTRQTTTNDAGGFHFPTVPGGSYEIKIAKQGFHAHIRKDVTVSASGVSRVDVALQLSAVAESVEVSALSALLQTDRSEVRSEITRSLLENAPLPPGRNYTHLFKTVPGFSPVTNANGPAVEPSRAVVSNVNGISRSSNSTRIDGAGVNQIWLPQLAAYTPALEAIEIVNVTTNSFDAEQGLAGGAAVNVQTKSGSNQLHGSAFEYHNDNKTKARPFFQPAGERNPKAIFNQFGGTVGGPIVHNKLFYFVSYEGTYNRQFASSLQTVPTADIRRGNMSASPSPIYDPLTGVADGSGRTPFADKIVPASRIEPIAQKIVALVPQPTTSGALTANLFAAGPLQLDSNRVDGKLNWNVSDKLTLFGRAGIVKHLLFSTGVLGELGGVPAASVAAAAGRAYGLTGNSAIGGTYIFTPSFIVDANFGYTAYDANSEEPGMGKNLGLDVLGIPGTNGSRYFESGWPRFTVTNYAVMGAATNSSRPFYNRDPRYQYVANGNWTKGTHNVRFGMDISRQRLNHTQAEFVGALHGPSGGFTFGGGPTLVRNGPTSNQFNTFASYLLGMPTAVGRTLQVPEEYNVRAWQHSLYIRDQWQATRKLTLSYGLRWEYFPVPVRVDRGLENYDPATNKVRVCGVGLIPANCGINSSKTLFGPRFGFAYRATDTLVVRGGYGITIDPYSLARPMRTNYPLSLVLNLNGPNTFQPARLLREGIPAIKAPDIGNGIVDIEGTIAANAVDKDFRRGYIQSWNLTLQKQFNWGFVGQAGYVATRQINQMGFSELNYGLPGGGAASRLLNRRFGRTAETRLAGPVGNSHYDSLQTRLDRRFANGFQFGVSYTWSKSIGICCNDNSDGLAAIQIPECYRLNRSLSGSDTPHNLQAIGSLELPFGKGKRWAAQGWMSKLAGGWQINALVSANSGQPFNVTAADTSLDAPGNTQRADQVKKDVAILGGAGRGQSYFDPFAFAAPTGAARFGTAGFRSLRGPGIFNMDVGLFRDFRIAERWHVQFRAESFNFTNTPHFAAPGGNVSNLQLNNDGSVRALGGFTEITGIANTGRDGLDERVFRFGLRVSF